MPFEVYRLWGLEFVELNLETFTKINYFTCYLVSVNLWRMKDFFYVYIAS